MSDPYVDAPRGYGFVRSLDHRCEVVVCWRWVVVVTEGDEADSGVGWMKRTPTIETEWWTMMLATERMATRLEVKTTIGSDSIPERYFQAFSLLYSVANHFCYEASSSILLWSFSSISIMLSIRWLWRGIRVYGVECYQWKVQCVGSMEVEGG